MLDSTAIDVGKKEQNENKISCKECVDVFNNFSEFDSHILSKHESVKHYLKKNQVKKNMVLRYSCEQCEYQAKNKTKLKLHRQARHEVL